ncbi:sensor domain CHASE-containing protein [Desulfacinum infernum DSM 9756]|uniref:histidine kinase n=2 Tax=Desulfacinum infernum TaxID=35837 RepID=A0A1M4XTG1_9BACT|nr:sensor domain CHASE-containing protein [Desulfacinum infernum DSM 9756]
MLRSRIFFLLLVVAIAVLGGAFAMARLTFVAELDKIEHQYAQDTLRTIESSMEEELNKLSRLTGDWAIWDDTYAFIEDLNRHYVESNLTPETLANLHVKAILFFDASGSLRYYYAVDLDSVTRIMLSHSFLAHIQSHPELYRHEHGNGNIRGILAFEEHAFLAASRPILTSTADGPIRGAVVFLRPLDGQVLDVVAKNTNKRLHFSLHSPADGARQQEFARKLLDQNDKEYSGRVIFRDLCNQPVCSIGTQIPRIIHKQARRTLAIYAFSLLIVVLLAGFLFWHSIDHKLFRRLFALVEKASPIRGMEARSDPRRPRDEIGLLSASLDRLIETLDQAIEQRTRMESEIQEILECSPVALFLIDRETRTLSWANSKALELIGRTRKEAAGIPCQALFCPSPDGGCPALDEGSWSLETESVLPGKGEEPIPVLRSVAKLSFRGRPHLLEAAMDLRHQKRLETELDRAKKMEIVGLVASGVAHDLNNLLTSLVGYPDMLLSEIDREHPFYEPLVTIRDASRKAGIIVLDLLTLARRGVKGEDFIEVNDLVDSFMASAEFKSLRRLHPSVRFRREEQIGEAYCIGSVVHLSKALANLVRNAAEAIEGSGSVTIQTTRVELTEPRKGYETVRPGRYVVLSVSDEGMGIPREELKRIFEPFYTKKKMGRSGSGLGMPIVWHAVKDMGGFIDLKSEVGRGTVISLYLPEKEPPSREEPSTDRETLSGRGEKVLIVEDMEDQRILAEKALIKLGYQVTSVDDGARALEHLRREAPDLLLLDLMLGNGMRGDQLYREILKTYPNQKALVVTGYADHARIEEILRLGASGCLAKPYTIEQLARAVHQALYG